MESRRSSPAFGAKFHRETEKLIECRYCGRQATTFEEIQHIIPCPRAHNDLRKIDDRVIETPQKKRSHICENCGRSLCMPNGVCINEHVPIQTFVEFMSHRPKPTHFTVLEGGEWYEWGMRGVMRMNVYRAHAIKFADGSIFDMVNGWRSVEINEGKAWEKLGRTLLPQTDARLGEE